MPNSLFDLGSPDLTPQFGGEQKAAPKVEKSIDQRFAEWLEANPTVFQEFVDIALKWKHEGHDRWSADAILAVIRWRRMELKGDSGFRCNDHFTSRLSRRAMAEVPELAGFFETRELKS